MTDDPNLENYEVPSFSWPWVSVAVAGAAVAVSLAVAIAPAGSTGTPRELCSTLRLADDADRSVEASVR